MAIPQRFFDNSGGRELFRTKHSEWQLDFQATIVKSMCPRLSYLHYQVGWFSVVVLLKSPFHKNPHVIYHDNFVHTKKIRTSITKSEPCLNESPCPFCHDYKEVRTVLPTKIIGLQSLLRRTIQYVFINILLVD